MLEGCLITGYFPITHGAALSSIMSLDIREQPLPPPGLEASALIRNFTVKDVPSPRKEGLPKPPSQQLQQKTGAIL